MFIRAQVKRFFVIAAMTGNVDLVKCALPPLFKPYLRTSANILAPIPVELCVFGEMLSASNKRSG